MKSSVKKLFAACAAMTAVAAVTALSASAAGLSAEVSSSSGLTKPTLSDDGNYVTVNFAGAAKENITGETTILLFKGTDANVKDEDILYINQEAKSDASFLEAEGVLPKEALEVGATYTMRVSDENGVSGSGFNGFYEVVFKVIESGETPSVVYGDVNLDGSIDASDALAVVNHFLEKVTLTGDGLLAADVNADNEVDASDALAIVNYFLEKIDEFPASSK